MKNCIQLSLLRIFQWNVVQWIVFLSIVIVLWTPYIALDPFECSCVCDVCVYRFSTARCSIGELGCELCGGRRSMRSDMPTGRPEGGLVRSLRLSSWIHSGFLRSQMSRSVSVATKYYYSFLSSFIMRCIRCYVSLFKNFCFLHADVSPWNQNVVLKFVKFECWRSVSNNYCCIMCSSWC